MSYDYSLRTDRRIGNAPKRQRGVYTRTMNGNTLGEARSPEDMGGNTGTPLVRFQDTRGGASFQITEELLSLGLLLLSAPGGGKTNSLFFLIREIIQKMRRTGRGKLIILDSKGDYYREFAPLLPAEWTYVLGSGREYERVTRYHNIFREIMPTDSSGRLIYTGEECDLDAKEIAEVFFEDMQSDTQPIFPAMGKGLLESVIVWHMRKYWRTDQAKFNNLSLRHFFTGQTTEEIMKIFQEDFMRDYRGRQEFISRKSNQTQGVISYVVSVLSKLLIGPFAKAEPGRECSIREIVGSRKPAVVFLEYDLEKGSILAPMDTLLIDQGLKRAMGGRSVDREPVYFVLDEFSLLPTKLKHAADGLSFGREQNVRVLVGLQNISALQEVYGEHGAKKILAGFQNKIAFKLTDYATRKYLSESLGENYVNHQVSMFNTPVNTQRQGYCVEDWDILSLKTGEGIVKLADGKPFLFHFPLYQRRDISCII